MAVKFCLKTLKIIFKAIIFFIFAVALFATYITVIERNLLIVKNKNIDITHAQGQTLKVVQFSDVHLGEFYTYEHLERAVKKINDQKPDIVVFTGDFYDIASQISQPEKAITVLNGISASLGKYAVFGNRDYGEVQNAFMSNLWRRQALLYSKTRA